ARGRRDRSRCPPSAASRAPRRADGTPQHRRSRRRVGHSRARRWAAPMRRSEASAAMPPSVALATAPRRRPCWWRRRLLRSRGDATTARSRKVPRTVDVHHSRVRDSIERCARPGDSPLAMRVASYLRHRSSGGRPMTRGIVVLTLTFAIAASAHAAPGDPRLVQGTLEWPDKLTAEPFVVVRTEDRRSYYAEIKSAKRLESGPLTAGTRVAVLGAEAARPHEITAIAIGSGDAAALAMALMPHVNPAAAAAPASPPAAEVAGPTK